MLLLLRLTISSFVFSDLLPQQEKEGHSVYHVTAANKLAGYNWAITYAGGDGANGNVDRDTVAIGGVTLTSQAVEAATSVSNDFTEKTDIDGVIGFGFQAINRVTPVKQKTFPQEVAPMLKQPLFAVDIKHQQDGTFDFGYTDKSKYTGRISYQGLSADDTWKILFSGYGVGTNKITTNYFEVLVDTGLTGIKMPNDIYQAYWDKVPGAIYNSDTSQYTFPCKNKSPDFYLKFDGITTKTPGSYLNFGQVEDDSDYCEALMSKTNRDYAALGNAWIKAQYVVFDLGKSYNATTARIGIADKTLTS